GDTPMRRLALLLALVPLALPTPAAAFCGFYVAKADTRLYNEQSKVVLARSGERTVITMASDYKGEARDFALVVPVPVLLEEDQIHVTDMKHVDALDEYSAPRLVEYHDENLCGPPVPALGMSMGAFR